MLVELLRALLILAIAAVSDRLIRLGANRLRHRATRQVARIALGVGSAGCRVLLWMGAGMLALQQLSFLLSIRLALMEFGRSLPLRLQQFFSQPIPLGRTQLTFWDLTAAIVATILIFMGARLLGRWLKRWVLSQSRLDRGMQEAIATLVTYIAAMLGITIVLSSIGLDMSSLTVVAGVVGLGFGLGLQELASNFVSGLTLLFEQQVRVGDFVELDGLRGTIERISIRSTIMRTNDAQYVIVPNHRFFQSNVVNWTYQSPQTRLHIPVSVAFGSDTVLVTETLLVAARMDDRVLRYPAPTVWFRSFGESAYLFELLVWIEVPQDHEVISSALNFLIEQELKRHGIEIPFPQRELHWRSMEAVEQLEKQLGRSLREAQPSSADAANVSLRHLLRQVKYFAQCTDSQLRVLVEQGYRRSFRSGQTICREGEPGDTFYIILQGQVEVISERLERGIAHLGEGAFFGEISLFTGMTRSATVRAAQATTVFVVDHRALQRLLQQHHELAEQIAQTLAERQQILKELGITVANSDTDPENAPFCWIRARIQTLFGI